MQDNYQIQAEQAKAFFLTYDQQQLIKKHHLKADDAYLYVTFLGFPYRIQRSTGDLSRLQGNIWVDGNSHGEVMTILDLICDSREDRRCEGIYLSMQAFGHQFHQNLSEQNPDALVFNACPQKLEAACKALGGIPFESGDIAFRIPVFEDLQLVLQFWLGDEEFAPRLRFLWDKNALQYLKYETMYFAVDVLMARIKEML